jgi:predicted enzyme related to lactoylglutathione lyase
MTSTQLITGVDFVYLPTTDFATALKFYGEQLGLPCTARYGRVPGGEFKAGNLTLQVLESEAIGRKFDASKDPVAFRVDDVEAARRELEGRGVRFSGATMDSGVCHMAPFTDPDGNVLLLHHRYAPASASG